MQGKYNAGRLSQMNDSELLLGIDIGTQGVKGVLATPQGKIVAQHYLEHSTLYPRPDWVEHDMCQNWWLNPAKVIQALLAVPGVKPEAIRGIGVSGLYPALGPTNANGDPICGAILYSDNRSVAEVEEVNRKLGLYLTSEELTPKLIWFLRHEPELAEQMAMFFDAQHYLVYKLCGEYVTDTVTTGLYGAIYESPTASWRADVCEAFDIPLDILPDVYPPATIVGTVHAEAAAATGLAVGTPVLTGMPDLLASLISVGAVEMHETAVYYGTAGLVPVMKDNLINAAFHPYPIAERGQGPQDGYVFDYPAYCLSTGDAVRWFRDEFGQDELRAEKAGGPSAYAQLDLAAAEVPAGSGGVIFLPYLQGQRSPIFNSQAVGVFFGLKKTHTRAHLYRAILESFGYSIRHGLTSFYPEGHPVRRLVATGGGARSLLWRQIVSDITALPQEVVPEADGALADAYMAGLALGWFDDFGPLKDEWIEVSGVTTPDSSTQSAYDAGYQVFVQLHDALDTTYRHHHILQSSTGGSHVV